MLGLGSSSDVAVATVVTMPDGSLIGRLPIRMRLRKTLLTTWNSDSSRGVDVIFTWGDWDNSGTDTIGVVRSDYGGARWMLSDKNAAVNYDFGWGAAYQAPISGGWCVAALGCVTLDGVDTLARVG